MKVLITYPPAKQGKMPDISRGGCLFQWQSRAQSSYPIVAAEAATVLRAGGFDVLWKDAVSEQLSEEDYLQYLATTRPDVIAIETSTPLIHQHWSMIARLKGGLPETKFVLMGEHVTALPEESLERSQADYILTGGDFDFLLNNLCRHLQDSSPLEPGIWYRSQNGPENSGGFDTNHDLSKMPAVDRILTRWEVYSARGGFQYPPGTCIMAARGCEGENCPFCSMTGRYPSYRTKDAEAVVREIIEMYDRFGIQEIVDCSGSFPTGQWLRAFCSAMITSGYNNKVKLSCNVQPTAFHQDEYNLMFEAGFRAVSFGLESVNDSTLKRLGKSITADEIIDSIRGAKRAGLSPMVTCIFGYPWEDIKEVRATFARMRSMFEKGLADMVRGILLVPYPGTSLFAEAKQKGWLRIRSWRLYDLRVPVLEMPVEHSQLRRLIQRLEWLNRTPLYFFRRITSIRNGEDVKSISREMKHVISPKAKPHRHNKNSS